MIVSRDISAELTGPLDRSDWAIQDIYGIENCDIGGTLYIEGGMGADVCLPSSNDEPECLERRNSVLAYAILECEDFSDGDIAAGTEGVWGSTATLYLRNHANHSYHSRTRNAIPSP
jgi:hypothetical protein